MFQNRGSNMIKQAMAQAIANAVNMKLAVSMGQLRGLSSKANAGYLGNLLSPLERLRLGRISPADFMKQRSRLGLAAELSDVAKPSAKAISEGMASNQAFTSAAKAQAGAGAKKQFTGGPGNLAGAGYTNTGGMFTPKPRPELNRVQTVGNPFLRMMQGQ